MFSSGRNQIPAKTSWGDKKDCWVMLKLESDPQESHVFYTNMRLIATVSWDLDF